MITMKNQCHGRDDLIVWLQGYIRMDTRIKEKYHCLNCGRYFNDLTNSILAFVREVQEIAEKIENKVLCQKKTTRRRYEKDA